MMGRLIVLAALTVLFLGLGDGAKAAAVEGCHGSAATGQVIVSDHCDSCVDPASGTVHCASSCIAPAAILGQAPSPFPLTRNRYRACALAAAAAETPEPDHSPPR